VFLHWVGNKRRTPSVCVSRCREASPSCPASAGRSLKRGRKIDTGAGYPRKLDGLLAPGQAMCSSYALPVQSATPEDPPGRTAQPAAGPEARRARGTRGFLTSSTDLALGVKYMPKEPTLAGRPWIAGWLRTDVGFVDLGAVADDAGRSLALCHVPMWWIV